MNAEAQRAVMRKLAEILRARYPGTAWLPVERPQDARMYRAAGKVVRRLAAPEDERAVGDGGESRAA